MGYEISIDAVYHEPHLEITALKKKRATLQSPTQYKKCKNEKEKSC